MNELDFQATLTKSAKHLGGYGRKISSRFTVGIPDLLLAVPKFCPVLVEAKWMKDVKTGFDREVPTTGPQRETLAKYNAVIGLTWGFVIVGWFEGTRMWAACVPGDQKRIRDNQSLDEFRIERTSAVIGFALDEMFYAMGVPNLS